MGFENTAGLKDSLHLSVIHHSPFGACDWVSTAIGAITLGRDATRARYESSAFGRMVVIALLACRCSRSPVFLRIVEQMVECRSYW